MKISRERIEQIRECVDAHIFPVGTIADLLTALDERDELIAQVCVRLVAKMAHRQLYDEIAEVLRGTKWGKDNG